MPEQTSSTRTTSGQIPKCPHHMPKIDFSMFIFSLNSSALVNLGVINDPATGAPNRNIGAAKQTIDILAMLHEKTKGNLSHEEDEMLQHILYDLRMIYVRENT